MADLLARLHHQPRLTFNPLQAVHPMTRPLSVESRHRGSAWKNDGPGGVKTDVLNYVGDIAQLGGLTHARRVGGTEDGLEVITLRTGALEVDIMPGRGLDIGAARFMGRSLAWLSSAGFSPPERSAEAGFEGWLRAFGGGLLTTCGLANVGDPCEEDGIEYGLHGRASFTPANQVQAGGYWQGNHYVLAVSGITREGAPLRPRLEKRRTLSTVLGTHRLHLTDTVTNTGGVATPCMLLYHLNLGFPLIQPGTRLDLPSALASHSEGPPTGWGSMPEPRANSQAEVLEHRLDRDPDGWARLSVSSPDMKLSLAVSETLTRFTQWRNFQPGDYVLGLEPGNVGVRGRVAERAAGTLPILEPGTSQIFSIELSVDATGS